jgi:hypothetical protein
VTTADAQRVALVFFAYREAGPGASLEAMLAICYCIRNRVKMQWEGGDWIRVMERAQRHSAHELVDMPQVEIDPESRQFQRLLREVDDIYYGGHGGEGYGSPAMAKGDVVDGLSLFDSMCERKHERLYWMHVERPVRAWFRDSIVRDPKNHPQRGALGTILFFE